MADDIAVTEEPSWGVYDLPLEAVAALGALPELNCGVLSPLSRLSTTPAAADAVLEVVGKAEDLSAWVLPALLDPRLTVGALAGDQDEALLLQFAWPDAEGRGPGFELKVGEAALTVLGPVDAPEVRRNLADLLLAPAGLPELPVVALTLSASDRGRRSRNWMTPIC